MSETVTYKGKLQEVVLINDNLEETCKDILLKNNIEIHNDFSYQEQLSDNFYKEYVSTNNKLYRVLYKENFEFDNIFNAELNLDGTISFLVKYYDGGCSFNEAIEKAMDNIPNEINVKWYNTEKNEFPEINKRIITSEHEIGYFNANYKFMNEITKESSIDEIIWTYLPVYNNN